MTKEEMEELSKLEGPVKSLTPRPLIEMTDSELEEFVTSCRDCTTQWQTMIAKAKVREKDKPDVNEGLFE